MLASHSYLKLEKLRFFGKLSKFFEGDKNFEMVGIGEEGGQPENFGELINGRPFSEKLPP